jgi:hypothetical protein
MTWTLLAHDLEYNSLAGKLSNDSMLNQSEYAHKMKEGERGGRRWRKNAKDCDLKRLKRMTIEKGKGGGR